MSALLKLGFGLHGSHALTREGANPVSLGIVIKGPEGIVLAAESRLTLTAENPQTGEKLHVNFDNATKLLSFSEPHTSVGVVTYGLAAIGLRTAASFVPEFESELPEAPLPVEEFATRLSGFFMQQWTSAGLDTYQGPPMTFVVAGIDKPQPYGRVFAFDVPVRPAPLEMHPGDTDFGITFGGQSEFMDRLLRGYDRRVLEISQSTLGLSDADRARFEQALGVLQMPLPLAAMPLQDCVNLAVFFIRTTIGAQSLTVGIRGVGGPIDVATVTRRDGLKFVRRKRVKVYRAELEADDVDG